MFSCEFCEIAKNTFFTEQLWWRLLSFMKKETQYGCFHVNFAKQPIAPVLAASVSLEIYLDVILRTAEYKILSKIRKHREK